MRTFRFRNEYEKFARFKEVLKETFIGLSGGLHEHMPVMVEKTKNKPWVP